MRIYDPRAGRFLSVDPITARYPELTPYQFANNSPIWAIDLDGAESQITISKHTTRHFQKALSDREVVNLVNNGGGYRAMQRFEKIVAFIRSRIDINTAGYEMYLPKAEINKAITDMIKDNLVIRPTYSVHQGMTFNVTETTTVDFNYDQLGEEKAEILKSIKKEVVKTGDMILGTYMDATENKNLALKALSYTLKGSSSGLEDIVIDEVKDAVVNSAEKQIAKVVGAAVAKRIVGTIASVLDPLPLGQGSSTTEIKKLKMDQLSAEVKGKVLALFLFGLEPSKTLNPGHTVHEEGYELRTRTDGTAVRNNNVVENNPDEE